jgi:hypothetical protein
LIFCCSNILQRSLQHCRDGLHTHPVSYGKGSQRASSMSSHDSSPYVMVAWNAVQVGPDTVTDPAYLVTRSMEDFVTWVDTSKIKRKVLKYNDKLDDYDLLTG